MEEKSQFGTYARDPNDTNYGDELLAMLDKEMQVDIDNEVRSLFQEQFQPTYLESATKQDIAASCGYTNVERNEMIESLCDDLTIPTESILGDMYYDTENEKTMVHNGMEFVSMVSGTSAPVIDLNNEGGKLIIKNANGIVLEIDGEPVDIFEEIKNLRTELASLKQELELNTPHTLNTDKHYGVSVDISTGMDAGYFYTPYVPMAKISIFDEESNKIKAFDNAMKGV